MITKGFPGTFPGGYTIGYTTIGAMQKKTNSVGFPGTFPGGHTTGYTTIGAVQKRPFSKDNDKTLLINLRRRIKKLGWRW